MRFRNAYYALLSGRKVRLPSWRKESFWVWEKETIVMYMDGKTGVDIREMDSPCAIFNYISQDDWELKDVIDNDVLRGVSPEAIF